MSVSGEQSFSSGRCKSHGGISIIATWLRLESESAILNHESPRKNRARAAKAEITPHRRSDRVRFWQASGLKRSGGGTDGGGRRTSRRAVRDPTLETWGSSCPVTRSLRDHDPDKVAISVARTMSERVRGMWGDASKPTRGTGYGVRGTEDGGWRMGDGDRGQDGGGTSEINTIVITAHETRRERGFGLIGQDVGEGALSVSRAGTLSTRYAVHSFYCARGALHV